MGVKMGDMSENLPAKGEFLLYQTDDGQVKIDVRLEDETIWLSQKQLAALFQTSIPNINMHIKNVFEEGELSPDSVIKEFLITASDGKNYRTKYYNLDLIISIGYRIKSSVATRFRISDSGVWRERPSTEAAGLLACHPYPNLL